MLIFKIFLKPR